MALEWGYRKPCGARICLMTGHNQDPLSSRSSPAEPDDPLVVLEFSSFGHFLQECSSRISSGGLFLEAEPRERVGSVLRFELRIRDGFRLLRGEGEVIRVHDPLPSSGEAAGVTVRFISLDEASQKLLPVVLDHYHQKGIPLLDLTAEVSSVEVEVMAQGSDDQEPAEVTLEHLWEEFELVPDRLAFAPDGAEISANVASEPALVQAGQPQSEADQEESEADLAAAARFLDEMESDIEAEGVVPADDAEAEATTAAEDEADFDDEAATEEGDAQPPEEGALDLAEMLPTAIEGAASLDEDVERLPDEMAELEEVSSGSWRQARELWLLILMAFLGILIGLVVYLSYQNGFEWPWSSGSRREQPASTELLAADLEEAPEQREIIAEYDFEDPAQVGGGLREAAGGRTPPETATPQIVNRLSPTPERRAERAGTQKNPPPRPASGVVLTGVDRITWRESQDQTVLTLWGDGPFDTDQLVVFRLDTGTPRQVVKILGISRPFSRRNLAVGTSHVSAIRTGLHTGDVGQELHVVADLKDPAVRMRRVEPEGSQLHVYFSKL